jgi:predicted component of type VI protein secretion system
LIVKRGSGASLLTRVRYDLSLRLVRPQGTGITKAGMHMKVNLVVASGAHQGRVIPLTGPQFLIGRDATCHMRPASQAISKRHCGVFVRDGKVYIKDFGSTNGTFVNDELIKNAEVLVEDGASLKLGPLDFVVRVEQTAVRDGTPLPGSIPDAAAALAAVKAASGKAAAPKAPARDATPNPAKPDATPGSKEAAALKTAKPAQPAPSASESADDEQDRIAAMLLGMDEEGGTGEVPDGSTVMELPAQPVQGEQTGAKPDDKGKKAIQSREDMSNAAQEILRKMMRRPK